MLWRHSPVMCNVEEERRKKGGEKMDEWMEVRAEWSDTKVSTLQLFLFELNRQNKKQLRFWSFKSSC